MGGRDRTTAPSPLLTAVSLVRAVGAVLVEVTDFGQRHTASVGDAAKLLRVAVVGVSRGCDSRGGGIGAEVASESAA